MSFVLRSVDSGSLRGADNGSVLTFLGVPYGASTAGRNRFRAPQPVEPWQGVRDALAFGPSAPQIDSRSSAAGNGAHLLSLLYPRASVATEGAELGEDCLRINVWAPSGAQEGTLPVLVWLHGGGFTGGSGNEMAFNGDVLASAANVVVVTVTHRLGLLGFLDLRGMGEPHSANAGMLDVVAALEWIKRNIAVFGGDPSLVTVCGQSGGSGKVAALNAMPAARELFVRSIMMSGPFSRMATQSSAEHVRDLVMEVAQVSSVQQLRTAPLADLLEVQAKVTGAVQDPAAATLDAMIMSGFAPSLDDVDLPEHPFDVEVTGGAAGKELLIGWTGHEAALFLAFDPSYTSAMSDAEAAQRTAPWSGIDGVDYAAMKERFPFEPAHLLLARRMSSVLYEEPARTIATRATGVAGNVWVYAFEQTTEVRGGIFGACHSLDLAYVFGTVDRIPFTGRAYERLAVSREMMRAWASFAWNGDPGWRPWDANETVHTFGTALGPHSQLPPDVDMAARIDVLRT